MTSIESAPPRVVIVEASDSIGRMLVTLLGSHAYHAIHLRSVDEATRHFDAPPDPIDLLVLDLGSSSDVAGTVALCRARHPECRVLLIGAPRLSEKAGTTHPVWPILQIESGS